MKKRIKMNVELVPNGWDWICPKCNGSNSIDTIPNIKPKTVECGGCNYVAKVSPTRVHVAIGRGTIWKIFSKKRSATRWVNRMRNQNPSVPKDNYCTEYFNLI